MALTTPNIKSLEEYTGLKPVSGVQAKNKSADIDHLAEDEEEEFNHLLMYLHFSEASEKVVNRVDGESLKFNSQLVFDELTDGEPLSFEDKWGRKITKAFSLRIQPKSSIEISQNVWKDEPLKSTCLQFWFYSYSEEPSTLMLSEKQSIIVGIKDHSLFLNSEKTNYYFDSPNKLGYKARQWNHLSLQIFSNSKVEIYFNGNFACSLDVKIQLARFKAEKIYLFPFFQGEVTEVRIWKKTFEAKLIKDSFKLPVNKIFEDGNKMKIKMKVRKREVNIKDTSQNSINLSLSVGIHNLSFDSTQNPAVGRKRTLNLSGHSPNNLIQTPDSAINSSKKLNLSVNSFEQHTKNNKSLVLPPSNPKSNFFNIGSETKSNSKQFFGPNYLKELKGGAKSEVTTPRRSSKGSVHKTFQKATTNVSPESGTPSNEPVKIERSNSDQGLRAHQNIFIGLFDLPARDLEHIDSTNVRELFNQENLIEFSSTVFQICRKFYFKDDFINAIGFLNKFAFQIVKQSKSRLYPILKGLMNYKAVFILFHRIIELKQTQTRNQMSMICFIWTLVLTLKLKSTDRSVFLAKSILVNYEARNFSTLRFLFRAIEKVY